ncbi:MAG: AAA family ATPase, partial [Candidatus Atribacteria bacterium]|nr:AAA family ATPase [Candidatus Atribacteria bacterium]
MLVEFRVRNFLSFSQEVVLSTVASALSELKETNVFTQKGGGTFNLLKSLAIYGANASGKSNFLEAFRFMQFMVLNSSKETQVGENIPVHPFVLSTETQDKPSEFEVTFLFNGARYRYGFSADLKHINREWLYRATSSREALLFERDNQKIEVGTLFRKEAKDCIKKTRTNALFLSVVANFAGEIAGNITNWFQRTKYISVENKSGYSPVIFKMLDEKVGFKEQIIQYLKLADEGIDTIDVETKTFEDLPR